MSAIPIPPRALRQLIVDTEINTPSTGHFLRYNGTKWVNVALVVGDIPSLAGTYQPLDADLTSWAAVTRGSGFDTFAATPSSANLRALITDETGTGALVFAGGNIGAATADSLAINGATLGSNKFSVLGTSTMQDVNMSALNATTGAFSGAVTVTSNSASALAVGRLGTTTPSLLVDASAASAVSGLKITSSASGGGILLESIGGTNEAITLSSRGTSNVSINAASSSGTSSLRVGNSIRVLATSSGVDLTGATTVSSTFSVNGASTFDSRINLKSYIVSTLPAAGVAGGVVYVSDAGGNGPCLAISNGTNWKRCDNTGTTVS